MTTSPVVGSRARLLMLVVCGASALACQQGSPTEPTTAQDVLDRLAAPLPANEAPRTVAAGTTEWMVGFGGIPRVIYAIDWTSASNHVTLEVYLDRPGQCQVPITALGGNGGLPVCQLVISDTSGAKPKLVEFDADTTAVYVLTATNHGPGDEMVRFGMN